MATRQDIIDVIDAYLEDKMTLDEAVKWAEREISRTDSCEDPAFTLPTFLGSDAPEEMFLLSGGWKHHDALQVSTITCCNSLHGHEYIRLHHSIWRGYREFRS